MAECLPKGAVVLREQALAAIVHRACAHCGAPGKYLDNEHIRLEHPACWVPREDERYDTPVGDRCPSCGGSRNPGLVERLGEIWRKRFYAVATD